MELVGQTLGPDPILKTLEREERAKVGNPIPKMAPPQSPPRAGGKRDIFALGGEPRITFSIPNVAPPQSPPRAGGKRDTFAVDADPAGHGERCLHRVQRAPEGERAWL